MTAIVDQNDLIGLERAFVDATGRNCQAQRITLYYGAKVSAGSHYPAAKIKVSARRRQMRSNV